MMAISYLINRYVFWLLTIVWMAILFSRFISVDEVEHAHVAWLMSIRGMTPLVDFFQHHQPILWHVIQPYFYFGGSGPEVLYYGRAIVLICAALCVHGLFVIARPQQSDKAGPFIPNNLGADR